MLRQIPRGAGGAGVARLDGIEEVVGSNPIRSTIPKRKGCFSFGVLPVKIFGQCGGAIVRAYDLGQSHHALRACLIRGSAGNESELFGIMTACHNRRMTESAKKRS